MKKLFSILVLILFVSIINAQEDSKKTNYFYDMKFGEQYNVFISAKNIVSKHNYLKLALEIQNKTDDYILFKEDKCKFVIDENSYFPKKKKKNTIIKPNKKKTITIASKNATNYLVETFDFHPSGIYIFTEKGEITKTEPFHLPPNKNQIEAGSFKINMLKLKKETSETAVKFKFTYTGDKVAVINTANCVLRTKDGKEWATVKSKSKPYILQKNESKSFTLIFKIPGKTTDMQFAEMDILWKNTFSESDIKELNFDIQRTNIDDVKTKEKN